MKDETVFKNTTHLVRLLPLVVIAAFCVYTSVAQAGSDALEKQSPYIATYSEMAFESGGSGDYGGGSSGGSESNSGGGHGGGSSGGSESNSSNAGEGGGYDSSSWGGGSDSSCCSGGDSGGGLSSNAYSEITGASAPTLSDYSSYGSPSGGLSPDAYEQLTGASAPTLSDYTNSIGAYTGYTGLSDSGAGESADLPNTVPAGYNPTSLSDYFNLTRSIGATAPGAPQHLGLGSISAGGVYTGGSVTYSAAHPANITVYNGSVTSRTTTGVIEGIAPARGGGVVGSLNGVTVMYSPTLSAQSGRDTWVGNVPPPDLSGGGGSGGSGGGSDGTNPNGSDNSTPTTVSLADGGTPWGGYWQGTRSCTSSGKGGQSCSIAWAWVATPVSDTSPCETASCSSAASSLGGGNGEIGATQQDLSIDATPDLVKNGDSSTITWSSINADSCTVTGPNDFSASGMSGSQVAVGITQQSVYTLICEYASGPKMTSATVNIIPVWREF